MAHMLGLVHSSGAHNIELVERRIGLRQIIRKVIISCIYIYIYMYAFFFLYVFLGVCVCEHKYRRWTTRRQKEKTRE